jgi:hypothetical protein
MPQYDTSEDLYPVDASGHETLKGYRAGMWAFENHDELVGAPSTEFRKESPIGGDYPWSLFS